MERKTHLRTLAPQMLSGRHQGSFLQWISKLISPKRILEIGTFTGYATICLATGLQEGGKLYTLEANEELRSLSSSFFERTPFKDKIIQLTGDAKELILTLEETWDMVFIDADKLNYPYYYQTIMPRVASGGVVIADNVLWYEKVILSEEEMDLRTKAIHHFNTLAHQDSQVDNTLLTLRDGLMMIRKK